MTDVWWAGFVCGALGTFGVIAVINLTIGALLLRRVIDELDKKTQR